MDLTDKQWAVLEPVFRPRRRPDGRGRPWTDPRGVLNAVLWILRTGAPGGICRAAIRPIKRATAASSSGNALAGLIGCCNASPKTSATAG